MKITPSYTIGISTKVATMRREGHDIVDLSIGEPDFHTPLPAVQRGVRSLDEHQTHYDAVPGLLPLREAIARKLSLDNGLDYAADEIVVTSGAKQAITNTLLAFLDPGDEVLIPIPYWVSYPEMVKLVGGEPVFVPTSPENHYRVTPEDLEPHISRHTKMLILNNPSNPSGALYSEEEVAAIVSFCVQENILLLADEIYERIIYDRPFTSAGRFSKDQVILVNGMSKAYAMTGLRIGYTASSRHYAEAMSRLQGHLVSHPSLTSQYIALGALESARSDEASMVSTYTERRAYILERLKEKPELTFVPPDGAFYLFVNISPYRARFDEETSFSLAFTERLLSEEGLAIVPGVAFGMDDHVRICYAASLEEIERGLDRFFHFLDSLEA
jgi:aspartate aminotransferase